MSCLLPLLSTRGGHRGRGASVPEPALRGPDRITARGALRGAAALLPQHRGSCPALEAPWRIHAAGTVWLRLTQARAGWQVPAWRCTKHRWCLPDAAEGSRVNPVFSRSTARGGPHAPRTSHRRRAHRRLRCPCPRRLARRTRPRSRRAGDARRPHCQSSGDHPAGLAPRARAPTAAGSPDTTAAMARALSRSCRGPRPPGGGARVAIPAAASSTMPAGRRHRRVPCGASASLPPRRRPCRQGRAAALRVPRPPPRHRAGDGPGSSPPASSITSVSVTAPIALRRSQALLERANRDASQHPTAPARPRPTSAGATHRRHARR